MSFFPRDNGLLSIFVYVHPPIFFDPRRAFDEHLQKIFGRRAQNYFLRYRKRSLRTKILIQKVVAGLAHQSCRLFVRVCCPRGS